MNWFCDGPRTNGFMKKLHMQGSLELCKSMLVIIRPSSSFQWCSGKCRKGFTSAGSFFDSWWFLCVLYYNHFRQRCIPLMYSWEELYTIGPYTFVTTLTKRMLKKEYIHIQGSAHCLWRCQRWEVLYREKTRGSQIGRPQYSFTV